LTDSQRTLAVEIHLSTLDSKSEPPSELVAEFARNFEEEQSATIQWAFREHRLESKFFPSISEIRALVDRRRRELWEAAEDARKCQEKADEEKARAEGKLVDIVDVKQAIADTVKRFPEPEHIQRLHRAQEAEAPVTPPLELTQDEIAARREQERAEIAQYKREA
jgi:hypothetical protein